MSRYFNENGEPLMTAEQARFEDYLDAEAMSEPMDPQDYADSFGPQDSWIEDVCERAEEKGKEYGKAKGSWVVDGNTSIDYAQKIIDGYNNGDPEIMDLQPSPLSGEFADEPTTSTVASELGIDENTFIEKNIVSAYEDGFSEGFWTEVIWSAKGILS